VTEQVVIGSSANVAINVGTGAGGTEVIDDNMNSAGFGLSTISVGTVKSKTPGDNETTGPYFISSTDLFFTLQQSTGNITDGTVTFIMEYIKL
jgi:hypothetical protein